MGDDDAELDGDDVLGDDVLGEDMATVGAALARLSPAARTRLMRSMRGNKVPRRALTFGQRPAWRSTLAPGIPTPGEGLEPLPLRPSVAAGVFSAAVASIEFVGLPQRPFHPERLIVSVRRNGASAAGLIVSTNAIIVGALLGQANTGPLDLEQFAAQAFGVRLQLPGMTPGMNVTIPANLVGGALAGADTIAVSMQFLGRSMR